MTSFADFWLVQAIAGNEEPGHPKSVFMYKNNDEPLTDVKYADELGGKLYAGPVWDFDWGTYNLFAAKKEQATDVVYYSMLFQYMQFKMILEERWKMIRPRIVNDIPVIIDEAVSRISPAVENDDMLYPYKRRSGNNVNYDSLYSYSRSIKSLKDYLKQRVETIDSQVFLNMSETS